MGKYSARYQEALATFLLMALLNGCTGSSFPSFSPSPSPSPSASPSPSPTPTVSTMLRWSNAKNNIYISDTYNDRIRMVAGVSGTFFGISMTAGDIYTIAGNGTASYSGDSGAATGAEVANPDVLNIDKNGNIYFADESNYRIRMIPQASGTYFGSAMTAGKIYTVAGNGTNGGIGDGGAATTAEVNYPGSVAIDLSGNLIIADNGDNKLRMVAAQSGTYFGVSFTAAGEMNTIVGTGTGGFTGDGQPATAAELLYPTDVSVDTSGNLYITDNNNRCIRKVDHTTQIISTVAGTPQTSGYGGDGMPATSAKLSQPYGTVVDSHGNIYIADLGNQRVRMVAAVSGTYFGMSVTSGNIYTIAGTGTGGFSSDGVAATSAELSSPDALSLDSSGNLYISDGGNNRIRKINASTGIISTVAGNGTTGFSTDGVAATSSELNNPFNDND